MIKYIGSYSTVPAPDKILFVKVQAGFIICTFANLVTEDLDLAVSSVNWFVASVVVAVCINLDH